MRFTAACLLITFLTLSGCGSRMDIGRLEYYRVSPRIPSTPIISEDAKNRFRSYTAVWGVLGTVSPDGPIMSPLSIRISGETFPVENWRYRLIDHRYYYMFEISGPLPDGFPHDMMTGNLFSQDPENRSKAPIKIQFIRLHDQKKWTGLGTVEQSTMVQMNAVNEVINAGQP